MQKVTNTGKEVLCESCITASPSVKKVTGGSLTSSPRIATAQEQPQQKQHETASKTQIPKSSDPNDCAGCGEALKEGQALIALDRQWHIWCFK